MKTKKHITTTAIISAKDAMFLPGHVEAQHCTEHGHTGTGSKK